MKQNILEKARQLFEKPLFNLISESHLVHRQYHDLSVQKCRLLSIKTGACPEDCGYCAQSVHNKTGLKREPLMQVDEVLKEARSAKKEGATRFCMGAAWRQVRDGKDFDRVIEMVKVVKAEGLEVCVTLGMLTEEQALRLQKAGVYAYNHNLDTSRDYYPKITSTRHYDDRLQTLKHVRAAGITVCSGGIIGLGESQEDRCALLAELASLDPQPESVPINLLSPVKGTPLENSAPVDPLDLVRMVAVARILMPKTRVRLSAGRITLTREAQTLAFLAGANSIFVSEKMLTVKNPTLDKDNELLEMLFASRG